MPSGARRHVPEAEDTRSADAAQPQNHDQQAMEETTQARMRRQFAKTDYCRFWPRCREGDQCVFAHSPDELRRRPRLRKTSLCHDWQAGNCVLKSRECSFAHGYYELKATEEFTKKTTKKPQGGSKASEELNSDITNECEHGSAFDQVGFLTSAFPSTPSAPCTFPPSEYHPVLDDSSMLRSQRAAQGTLAHVIESFQHSLGPDVVEPLQHCHGNEQTGAAHELTTWVGGAEDRECFVTQTEATGFAVATQRSSTTAENFVDGQGAHVIARLHL